MPRTCTICTHDLRHEINVALVQRDPYRHIASQYGVSTRALQRHSKDHLPQLLLESTRALEVARADDLLGAIEHMLGRLEAFLDRAEADQDGGEFRAFAGEWRKHIELLARIAGELQENQINIHLHPQWVEIQNILVSALSAYPEARAAVFEALEAQDVA